jgi:hypothetical protein
MEYVLFAIVIAVVLYAIYKITSGKKSNVKNIMDDEETFELSISSAQHKLDEIYETQNLPTILTDLLLKKGEEAYLDDVVALKESRSKTISTRGGGAVRIAKGVYVGGSQGVSRQFSEMRDIDRGHLTLTNKRIIFSGHSITREYQLDKIIEVSVNPEGIILTYQGKEKKPYFTGIYNYFEWTALIKIMQIYKETGKFPHMELETRSKG